MSSITFVTAYFDIYDTTIDNRDNEWRYNNFEKIAKTGINICLYTNNNCYNALCKIIENYPNVKLMPAINLEDTIAYKICQNMEYSLPDNRNIDKDTDKYMFIQHSKMEFVNNAVLENPWNSTHFAWIDFNVTYIFGKLDNTLEYLKILSMRKFIPKLFAIPGCWNPLENIEHILNSVYWRFCGTFFLGDSDSVSHAFQLYESNFEIFIREHKKLVWDVNFWTWMEVTLDWKPNWYLGNHNDSILNIPTNYYAIYLNDKLKKTAYNYPQIENFFPSSPAYLYHQGKQIVNTRYVNYSYYPNGRYNINHPDGTIITKNILTTLDDNLLPMSHSEMTENNIGLEHHDMYSVGLEDIRLYSYENTIKYIATNVNYIGHRANRMIIGEYNIDSHEFGNSKIIYPPTPTHCEKNWIPIIMNNEEYFIYKWSPYELGKVNPESNHLEIVKSYEINSPDFHRIRGSTIFIDNIHDNNLIGVVHFCEETNPRQYYHMLVTLDKETFCPVSYSDPFCFQHHGVEFCIGFTIKNDNYVFWISKKDNDAIMVTINMNEIPISHIIS
jgi:hypothetical protein